VKGKEVLVRPFHVVPCRPPRKNSIGGGGSGRLSLGASRPRGPLPGMIGRAKLVEKVR
jgi:hypothetical protein